MVNPLVLLEKCGQSVWLDYISRGLLDDGGLKKLIDDDHLKGVTSNPSIFEKAIAKTSDYDQTIALLCKRSANDAKTVYEYLAVKDIRDACHQLRPVYDRTDGCDGFASLEVSPHLAFDAEGTAAEGLRLWQEVNCANLMIKVPGTNEGMVAIRSLISRGVNVNVTLLFSVNAYIDAANAYLQGLKDRLDQGLSIDTIHSVASFFISRIDSKLDAKLKQLAVEKALQLVGKIAIANAKVAYNKFERIYESALAKTLLSHGATPQRLLWASTSTKNARYSDVLYVESLIAKSTVNTMPLETLNAFRDHGRASLSLMENQQQMLDNLAALGLDYEALCQELLQEGIELFATAFDQLLAAIAKKL